MTRCIKFSEPYLEGQSLRNRLTIPHLALIYLRLLPPRFFTFNLSSSSSALFELSARILFAIVVQLHILTEACIVFCNVFTASLRLCGQPSHLPVAGRNIKGELASILQSEE